MSFKPLALIALTLGTAAWAQPSSGVAPTVIQVPVVIPSVGDLLEAQKRKATTEYIRRLKLQDPDITDDGKLKLPEVTPRFSLAVRYLFGTPDQVKALIETQGTQRTLQTGDKFAGFDVRVTAQGVSFLLTRKGEKEGWTEPQRPGLYQEYY
jgi:hypothetical protein